MGRHNGEMFEVETRATDIGVGVRDVTHWAYVQTPEEQCEWKRWENMDDRHKRQARHRFPNTKDGAFHHFRWGVDRDNNVIYRLDPTEPEPPEHYEQV